LAAQTEIAGFANAQVGYNLERRTLITIEAMRWLSQMLGGLPGRKNIVWLTAELPFDLIPENRNMSDAELLASLPNMQSKPVQLRAGGAVAAEQRELHGQEIRAVEAQLASTSIAIYPVDLHGLLGGMDTSFSGAHDKDIHGAGIANRAIYEAGSLQASQGTMEEVAAETGGKPYMNENEIRQGVALAAADDKASYEIGYYPENKKWDGKYRSIKVKIAQGDTQIRYRKGYFAFDTTQTKNVNYEQDVAAALQFNVPATQISFMAQAKPTDPGKVRVMFLVDAHTLTAENSGGN
jgi:VWFA-related protein